jgi:hypothetical protein
MAGIVNVEKLNKIRDCYPATWSWMQHKAKWECMCMGAVLNYYETHIDELMAQEASDPSLVYNYTI